MSYMWERRLRIKSRLIQPRGLKWEASRPALRWSGRGLYSLVDWNMTIRQASAEGQVEAYTASWIEIFFRLWKIIFVSRRGLYSLVDWNKALCVPRAINKGRGLYSLVDWNFGKMYVFSFLHCRGLYSLVDWNIWEEAEWTWFNVGAYTASWIEMMVSVNARSCR